MVRRLVVVAVVVAGLAGIPAAAHADPGFHEHCSTFQSGYGGCGFGGSNLNTGGGGFGSGFGSGAGGLGLGFGGNTGPGTPIASGGCGITDVGGTHCSP